MGARWHLKPLLYGTVILSACVTSAQTFPSTNQLPLRPDVTAISSTPTGSRLTVSGARPIKNIVMSLTEEHGNIVDYEELPIKDDTLFQDTATDDYRSQHGGKGWLSPKSFNLDLQLATSLNDRSDVHNKAALKELVSKYNALQVPYAFKIVNESADRSSIVATSSRDSAGILIPQPVLLDFVVQLDPQRQTVLDALSSFAKQLASASGKNVAIGTMPANIMINTYCVPPSGAGTARTILAKLLDASPVRLAWILMHDRQSDTYFLNAVVAKRYVYNSRGGRVLMPVPRGDATPF